MSDNFDTPVIAFMWRPEEIKSSVVETARRTGARIIFDLSQADLNAVGINLLHADASNDVVDLKISPAALLDSGIAEFLEETAINRLWVEFQPRIDDAADKFWERIEELSDRFDIVPVLGDVALIRQILKDYQQIRNIALKGSESSGFVSTETAFTLYSAVREITRGSDDAPNIFLWGGIAVPEAAAAFLATGARGVVFESVHWLTDLVSLDAETRKKIANLRPDHTDLIGMNLGVPCRFFNKGNSKAVKELKDFAGSLCGAEIGEEQRRFLAEQVQTKSVHPLSSKFARDELIPIGVEAAFADSFVKRFGSKTEEAFDNFLNAIDECLSSSPDKQKAFVKSPTAAEMGTEYPFIQGAMSWITDSPEFARKIADAGGLPTLALGMMEKSILDEKLGRLREIMGDKPYAVNVITLAENPHRDVQLQWIRQTKPRFAVIAAGEPSHAADLMKDGIEAIYIAPNEELLKMAFEAGVRYVICEGHEAGGHVGQHSTLTLAQMIFDLKHREPQLFKDRKVILAGGICNRETAFMAAMLGADAVQMGTSYLATSEIVEAGALTAFYRRMIVTSEPGSTVITGEGTGLRVRSLRTPKIEAVCSLERDFASGSEDEASFRHKIEALSAGSLFVAARGLDRPNGSALDDDSLLEQGQFMSGACAGVVKTVRTVAEFHHELSEAPLSEGLPVSGPIRQIPRTRPSAADIHETPARKVRTPQAPAYRQSNGERIAVTGMSVVNSLGNSPEEVWAACLAMKSGIVPVPQSRWDHEIFFHPRPRMPEKTYCKVGAFQNIQIDRKDIGVPPQDFRTMTDATKISMWLARNAVEESGILDSDIPRERIGVLISQNSGEAAATLQDVIIRGALTKIVSAVKSVVPLDPATEEAVAEAVKSGRIAIDDTTLLGRLNCSAGGFICNKYGFMGPSFSVSAACATALVALFSAVQMIRNGIIDAAVVGGGEEFLTPMHFLEFSALGALAGLSGVNRLPWEISRPFDADRDGMVLGEGGGMIVIERESVAKRRGASIHAYITSMGASNNHLGMVESSRITQEIAVRSSFNDASYGPEGVDMIECHATSTRQGDVEEVQALKGFYNGGKRTVLTSFKSQIGHTLGASGVNSLIRGIMAMKAGVFPPTLNCKNPDPDMAIEGSGITILPEAEEWKTPDGRPRRFQVNAFGFGGSNYVVQLEESMNSKDTVVVSLDENGKDIEIEDQRPMPGGISFYKSEIGGKSYRVSVVADTDQEAQARIASTEPFTDCGPVAAKRLKALARQSIYLGQEDIQTPPLAFVFPGQGSHYAGMSHELYQTFPIIREWMDRAAEVAEFDILKRMFFDSEEDLQKTRWQQPALFTMEYAMVQYLVSLGIQPAAMAGHSLGELTALCLAGVYSFEDGFRIVNKRAICMDKACSMHVDPGVMMAVDAPMEVIEEILAQTDGVYITNFNSLHQIVLGGSSEKVSPLGVDLKAKGYRNTLLRVSMAFHSPIMECIHDELEEFIAGIEFHPPKLPVISNTTMKPFPADTSQIKKIVMAHLESPVHWIQNMRTLWNGYGVRLFVEVGPRDILSNLIADTLDEAECLQTCLPSAEAMIYRTALAQLFARGHLQVKKPLKVAQFPKSCKAPEPVQTQTAPAVRPQSSMQVSTVTSSLEGIVQREIGAFMIESFGRFLRPNILAAIKRDFDPKFGEQDLENLLAGIFPGTTLPAPQTIPAGQTITIPVIPTEKIQEPGAVKTLELDRPDTTEMVIQIIMEATGYERDEIEPDMDLREDLSIRSSRLPVIMDSVESHFDIKIELEDFMDVRTIRDISDRISQVISKQTKKDAAKKAKPKAPASPSEQPEKVQEQKKQAIKRIIFREIPLEPGSTQPVELSPLDSVAVFSAKAGTGIRKKMGNVFRRDYGVNIIPAAFLEKESSEEGKGFDFRYAADAKSAQDLVEKIESLAGIAFVLENSFEQEISSLEEIPSILRGFFGLLRAFLESPTKKFAILVDRCEKPTAAARLLAEGVLAMFLSAAQEYSSVQFRTVRLDAETDLHYAVRRAMDRSQKVVETIYHQGNAFTLEGSPANLTFDEGTNLDFNSDHVVVLSGGAYGITPFLAKSFMPFGCKTVLLGRTVLGPNLDLENLVSQGVPFEEVARKIVSEQTGLSPEAVTRKASEITKALEIVKTVNDLRSVGIDASYLSCDVTDPKQVKSVVQEIVSRYGRIDGIVHGAGILKDNFIRQMSADDFSSVVSVKFEGALNLFESSKEFGLKFFACLSSAASIQGNPGQSNYAAANRMMSALMSRLKALNASIIFKALILPPIEGAGMAENDEIRSLMKRMNAEYVHAEELAVLFSRELLLAPTEDVWVLFMRSLPDLSTVRLDGSDSNPSAEEISVDAVSFPKKHFPMLDSVVKTDLPKKELTALRSFSQERDLWIVDHKPFKFLKHPLVSAIMALETFMEASRVLYPQLEVRGIQEAQFLDIIECPKNMTRSSEILCRSLYERRGEAACEVSLATKEISPTGRVMERMHDNYKAIVLLGRDSDPGCDLVDFPVKPDELDSRSMDKEEALKWYQDKTDMQNRYRVMESLDGTAQGAVRGRMVYRVRKDFSSDLESHYQYSPYLLEALMQVVNFYIVMRDPREKRSMIPAKIGEMRFFRKCSDGEIITLEARMRNRDTDGICWDTRALDQDGNVLMFTKNLMMRWFSK